MSGGLDGISESVEEAESAILTSQREGESQGTEMGLLGGLWSLSVSSELHVVPGFCTRRVL